ncbi:MULTISPECIES: DUF58 domain-containing protein [Haloferax]|uniref:DUF58 domain-containing protein n=2 Tax=Haloferax TaxID=2251 RepID=A0A6G1Z075_9EURY|nr:MULTISPECIES: DUF58 domain-containing protein [Haloferax]KAB1187399.1 DUF58 domain-containing protein [Haloferax sp. CBA1149]MRW80047.1 DUF58 domain-containing protein [Haloferax marinisediminis]
MKLTVRGWVAVAAVVVGVANAVAFGPRALNAVVVPIAVALVVGAVQVWRVSPPRVVRDPPEDGFPGETATVSLTIDSERTFPATTTDTLSDGLGGDSSVESVVGDGTISYDVRYRARGPARVGPATIVAHDLLGLFSRTFTAGGVSEVLVFPRTGSLTTSARRDLSALSDRQTMTHRGEFDRLREYESGDPLRDIHWKSSAKSGDLVVKTYINRTNPDAVSVSAGGVEGREDDVAEAAATIACSLLDAGVPVHLTSPLGVTDAVPGERRHILAHLSRLESGSVPDSDAEVVVRGDAGQTYVTFGGRETTFDQLRARSGGETDGLLDGNQAVDGQDTAGRFATGTILGRQRTDGQRSDGQRTDGQRGVGR